MLLQIRVGGQAARHCTTRRSRSRCGCVGQETTGAGGFAKAMRTVPVVLEIAERVRERAAPDAWIVDFTNPVGIVTRALLDAGHRAVGLCNVAIGFQRRFAARLGVEPAAVAVDQVGLNHLTWMRAVWVDGEDGLDRLLAELRRRDRAEDRPAARACSTTSARSRPTTCATSTATTRCWPSSATASPRAQRVAEIERELLAMYRDPALDDEAGAARAARRRVLQRGGGRAGRRR